MQKSLVGQNPLRITQGENGSTSHAKSLAQDWGGANTGAAGNIDYFLAPWDGKVVRADGSSNNAMYIESLSGVLAPNGSRDIQRLVLIHTNKYLLSAGQTFKQGDKIYIEGTAGGVQAHIHIEGGFGTWASVGGAKLTKNSVGTWCIAQQAHLYEMLFVPDDYTINNGGGYNWIRASKACENNTTNQEDDMKLRVYKINETETFRTSQLVEQPKEHAMTIKDGKPVFLKPVSAHEVFPNTISGIVEKLVSDGEINANTIAFVQED